jgi:hypothetical protein
MDKPYSFIAVGSIYFHNDDGCSPIWRGLVDWLAGWCACVCVVTDGGMGAFACMCVCAQHHATHPHTYYPNTIYIMPEKQTLFYVRGTVISSIWPQILLGLVLVSSTDAAKTNRNDRLTRSEAHTHTHTHTQI